MSRVLTAFLLVLALAVVAGCGSDDSSTTAKEPPAATAPATPPYTTAEGTPTTPATTTEDSSGGEDAGGEVEIKMENIQFAPTSVTVKVGQTVKWVNEDSVDHNVVADDDKFPASDNFGKGGTYTFKADKPGTFKYTCTIHPGMDGELIVK